MDQDMQELLKEIEDVTFEIRNIYHKLYANLTSPNPDQKLTTTLIDLIRSKKYYEADLYSYLENMPKDLFDTYTLLYRTEQKCNESMNEDSHLCYKRIINNLYILILLNETNFNIVAPTLLKDNKRYKYLINQGLKIEDAFTFYRKFTFHFEKSLGFRYITVLNNEIPKSNNPEDLIKLKLDTAFVRGNEVEDNLFDTNFTTVHNNLDGEIIKPDFGIDPELKADFLDMSVLLSIHKNLNLLKNAEFNSSVYPYIYEFQTFLLYLSKNNLNVLRNHLIETPFKSEELKRELFNLTSNVKKDRLIHNSDNKEPKVKGISNQTANILNRIIKITKQISDTYDLILKTINSNEDFSSYLSELTILKNIEQNLYLYFSNNYDRINTTLNFIITNQTANLNEKESLCAIRIAKNLSRIYTECLSNNPNLITTEDINEDVINYLISKNYPEKESQKIYLKIQPLIEKSVATTLHNTLLEILTRIKDKKIHDIYFKRILLQSFTTSSTFEEELIANHFSFINNSLNNDLTTVINTDDETKETTISLSIQTYIEKLLSKFIEESNSENLDEIFYQLKAYFLHSTIKDLQEFLIVINILSKKYTFDHEFLTTEINKIIELKTKSKGLNN